MDTQCIAVVWAGRGAHALQQILYHPCMKPNLGIAPCHPSSRSRRLSCHRDGRLNGNAGSGVFTVPVPGTGMETFSRVCNHMHWSHAVATEPFTSHSLGGDEGLLRVFLLTGQRWLRFDVLSYWIVWGFPLWGGGYCEVWFGLFFVCRGCLGSGRTSSLSHGPVSQVLDEPHDRRGSGLTCPR